MNKRSSEQVADLAKIIQARMEMLKSDDVVEIVKAKRVIAKLAQEIIKVAEGYATRG